MVLGVFSTKSRGVIMSRNLPSGFEISGSWMPIVNQCRVNLDEAIGRAEVPYLVSNYVVLSGISLGNAASRPQGPGAIRKRNKEALR